MDRPEGFIYRPVPAHQGSRAEEDKPEDGETEVHAVLHIHNEVGQTRQQVQEEGHTVIYRARDSDSELQKFSFHQNKKKKANIKHFLQLFNIPKKMFF